MSIEDIKKLSEKITPDAIQRTKKAETKRGYDTDGYGYQYIVDRLNDVLGENWGYNFRVIRETEGNYKSGQPYYDVTVEVSIWINDRQSSRACVGGHIAVLYSDALKGAITNGFKKTAAFWGVGRDAYAGTLDDDNKPLPDETTNMDHTAKKTDKELAAEKLAALPENIKAGLKALGYNGSGAYVLCQQYGWDNDRILKAINEIADKGAA